MASYINVGAYKINNRRELGSGTFGKVYKATHLQKGTAAAAKKITLDGSQEGREFVTREIDTLRVVKHHPYILR